MAKKPKKRMVTCLHVHQHTPLTFQLPTPPNHHLTQLQNSALNLISPKLSISPNPNQIRTAAKNRPKSLIHNLSTLISINQTPTEISPAKKLSTIKNPPLISINKIRPFLDKNRRYDIESYPQFRRSYPHGYPHSYPQSPKHNKKRPRIIPERCAQYSPYLNYHSIPTKQ